MFYQYQHFLPQAVTSVTSVSRLGSMTLPLARQADGGGGRPASKDSVRWVKRAGSVHPPATAPALALAVAQLWAVQPVPDGSDMTWMEPTHSTRHDTVFLALRSGNCHSISDTRGSRSRCHQSCHAALEPLRETWRWPRMQVCTWIASRDSAAPDRQGRSGDSPE